MVEKEYSVTGIMSGTSLDGIDLAACVFIKKGSKWNFSIKHCVTYPFNEYWFTKLGSLANASAMELGSTHFEFGKHIGKLAKDFHEETGFDPEFISSHGQTIFHAPEKGYTIQIGSGAAIAATSGKPVVCDFRSTDVCLGGQGAPLVPTGDELLFNEYDACLNLGGFSNISFNRNGRRMACDICPANTVLNKLATQLGSDMDSDGKMARAGIVVPELLNELNELPYYSSDPPKSLGMEWVVSFIEPILNKFNCKTEDALRNFTEHIAMQISNVLNVYHVKNLLMSGGGTHNKFLVERLKALSNVDLIIPDKTIIDYKESLIFAFLGLLRWIGQNNCLASVTGARHDSVCGAVYLPVK